ncbi:hypothetical protein TWF694_008510 [Orbilia ellipsospora]|uniref:Uncharacterized protein n=1 Tax=Orbilia ellipsospora TaxID=2528407 RepID=A0AAV9XGT5_9PEZI
MAKKKNNNSCWGWMLVIVIVLILIITFTQVFKKKSKPADPLSAPAYSKSQFPRGGYVSAKKWFPGLSLSYQASDNSYLPECGQSTYGDTFKTHFTGPFSNSPECTAAMKSFSGAKYGKTAAQLFDVGGRPISDSEVVKGRHSCLCFAMFDEAKYFSDSIMNYCLLIGENLDVEVKELPSYGSDELTVGLWQFDSVRNTSGPGILPNCTATSTTDARVLTSIAPAATPTLFAGILNEVNTSLAAPTCLNDIQVDCPVLYDNIKLGCYRSNGGTNCICSSLQMKNSTCQSVCDSKKEATSWMNYISDLCPSLGPMNRTKIVPNDTNTWIDFPHYNNITYQAFHELLPWTWNVSYSIDEARMLRSNQSDQEKSNRTTSNADDQTPLQAPVCPTRLTKLGVFMLINLITFCSSLVLGRRDVVHFISCKVCGSPDGSPFWPLVAIFFAGLSFCSNIINAYIVKSTPGFHHVPITDLFLLWCCRPRIAWMGGLLIFVQKEKAIYFGTATNALFTELVLQIAGGVYIFRTVNFATKRGYYPVGALKGIDGGKAAWIMYSGALLWAIFIGLTAAMIVWSFFGTSTLINKAWRWTSDKLRPLKFWKKAPPTVQSNTTDSNQSSRYPSSDSIPMHRPNTSKNFRGSKGVTVRGSTGNWEDVLDRMGLTSDDASRIQRIIFWMALPFIGQWLFWAGYIDLFGDMYCPPKLGYIATVWATMSAVGVLVGASV